VRPHAVGCLLHPNRATPLRNPSTDLTGLVAHQTPSAAHESERGLPGLGQIAHEPEPECLDARPSDAQGIGQQTFRTQIINEFRSEDALSDEHRRARHIGVTHACALRGRNVIDRNIRTFSGCKNL
jgi:hypothetical protein